MTRDVVCSFCGQSFQTRSPHALYCSKRCKQAGRRKREDGLPLEALGPVNLTGRYMETEVPRRKPVPEVVGNKPKKRPAMPRVPKQGVSWKEAGGPLQFRDNYKGKRNKSGLPNSGAPRPSSNS